MSEKKVNLPKVAATPKNYRPNTSRGPALFRAGAQEERRCFATERGLAWAHTSTPGAIFDKGLSGTEASECGLGRDAGWFRAATQEALFRSGSGPHPFGHARGRLGIARGSRAGAQRTGVPRHEKPAPLKSCFFQKDLPSHASIVENWF